MKCFKYLSGALLLASLVTFTACEPPAQNDGNEQQGNNDAAADQALGAIQPWPPQTYGNPVCGTYEPAVNGTPLCTQFEALKECLQYNCNIGCRPVPCELIFYNKGCPSSEEDGQMEICTAIDTNGNPTPGRFHIGQYKCPTQPDFQAEKDRCKVPVAAQIDEAD